MKKATMQERTLKSRSGEKIVKVEIIDNGLGIKCYTMPRFQPGSKEFEKMFPIVDIEGISLNDSFMQYEPGTELNERAKSNIQRVKSSIIEAKELEMKNFRRASIAPSLEPDGKTIIYCVGEEPAKSRCLVDGEEWWDKNAPIFMPEKNSRLMDDLEEDAFLGTIIKYLVEEKKYAVVDAWDAVCVKDKSNLGHEEEGDYDRTGTRKVGKWYDLGKYSRIVKSRKKDGFLDRYLVYSRRNSRLDFPPLADAIDTRWADCFWGVGEIRLDV